MLEIIPEVVNPDRRLGRHIEHDERSRAFAAPRSVTLKSVMHPRYRIGVLDQGNLGSCTGNAATGLVASKPHYGKLAKGVKKILNEDFAVGVYKDATLLDPFPGSYPPDDTGSTGLSVLKVLQQRGYIGAYYHCFGLDHTLQTLTLQPVIIGVNWYSSFDTPTDKGFLEIASDAEVRGGHEMQLRGLNVTSKYVEGWNSWGPEWGLHGRFRMSFDTLGRLLKENGDAATADVIA